MSSSLVCALAEVGDNLEAGIYQALHYLALTYSERSANSSPRSLFFLKL